MSAALRIRRLVLITLLGAGTNLPGADAESVAATLATRMEASVQAYKDQSARIADEKIPLVREINQLEDENSILREKIEYAQLFTAENNKSFDALRNRLEGLKAQSEFVQRFLGEYLDSFETRINTAEDQHYKDDLTKIRLALEQRSPDLGARFGRQLEAFKLGLTRAESALGGYQFTGQAIASDGVLKTGTVVVLGPVAYFSDGAAAGGTAGLLKYHTGTIEPAVVELDGANTGRISRFITEHEGSLPLDASLGNALAIRSTNVRLGDHIARGGPVGYSILILGLAAIVLTVVKLFDIAKFRSVTSADLTVIIREARARHEAAAITLARKTTGPVGEMLELGVRNVRANLVLLEELMLSVVLRRRPEIERFLPFLAITVVAAPLLGLLGTVVGMIRTFALITVFGTGDPRALSSGISEALITTEFGLMIAIPTLVVHGVLTRMIKSRFADMERIAFEFVKTVALEEDAATPRPGQT